MRRYLATAETRTRRAEAIYKMLPEVKCFGFYLNERDEETADKLAICRAQLVMREKLDYWNLTITEQMPNGIIRVIYSHYQEPIKGFGSKL